MSLLPPDDEPIAIKVRTKQEEFKHWFDYNPATGALNKIRYGKYHTPCFKPANLFLKRGILWTNITNISVPAKHLIWCYMTGHYPTKQECVLGDSLKFKDLKLALRSDVEHHIKKFDLRLGVQRTASGKFSAAITKNRRRLHLGCFETAQLARIAYMQKKLEFKTQLGS